MIGLGIDAGGSSSRWCLYDDKLGELGSGKLGPIIGHIYTAAERKNNLEQLATLLDDVLAIAKPDGVMGGITGLHTGTEAANVFTELVSDKLGLDQNRIQLMNDMSIAYASVFEPGKGVLVYGGTGSVGCHVTGTGELIIVGGCGYMIDDAGAGFWIGREAVKQVIRWSDELGRPAKNELALALYEMFGTSDKGAIRDFVYKGGVSGVAALAPAVARAAHQKDEAAIVILEQAGRELARLANSLFIRLDMLLPTAFAGGISRLSPILTMALKAELPDAVECEVVKVEPSQAAARLAVDIATASFR